MSKFKYTFDELLEGNNLTGDMALIFDRGTGKYIKSVFMPVEGITEDHPLYVVFFENYCIQTHTVEGNVIFDDQDRPIKNYKIVELPAKPMQVSEKDFEELTAFNITKEYKLCKQINLIAAAVLSIAESNKVEDKAIKDLRKMVRFIEEYKQEGDRYRKSFIKRRGVQLMRAETLDRENKGDAFAGITY